MNVTKRTALLCTAVLSGCLAASALPAASASAADSASIVILGDSIAAGDGLSAGEMTYADYLSAYNGGNVTNLAVSGYTTGNLLTFLEDASNAETVSAAAVICVSIGANDLIQPAKAYFQTLKKDDETAMDTIKRYAQESTSKALSLLAGLTREISEPKKTAKANIDAITAKLRSLNPDAKIIYQTIYNPAELPARYFRTEKYSDSDISNYQTLCSYIGNNLEILNKAMRAQEGVEIADVYKAFGGAGWMFSRILEKDIHPTPLGHAMIASVYMEMLGTKDIRFENILPMIGRQDYSDFLSVRESYRNGLMKYTTGELTGKFGDGNSDNQIDVNDAQLVLNWYVCEMAHKLYGEGVTYTGASRIDVNLSGDVDVADAQCILNYYVKAMTGKPVTWAEITGNPNAPAE